MSSEFIGRTGAMRLYSYPLPRFSGLVGPFANNFAAGPSVSTDIPILGVSVPWAVIYSGGAPSADVPITPKSTGIIRVSAVIVVKNESVATQLIQLQVLADNVPFLYPALVENTIGSANIEAIPVLAEIQAADAFAIGVLKNIRIIAVSTSDIDVSLVANESTICIEEVAAPTG